MPDPAKSVGDIDDVLASIRRLVAEQPVPARADTARATGPATGGDERLVLTPALRVTDPDRPAMTARPSVAPSHDTAEAEAPETSGAAVRDTDTDSGPDTDDAATFVALDLRDDGPADTAVTGAQAEDVPENLMAEDWLIEEADDAGGDPAEAVTPDLAEPGVALADPDRGPEALLDGPETTETAETEEQDAADLVAPDALDAETAQALAPEPKSHTTETPDAEAEGPDVDAAMQPTDAMAPLAASWMAANDARTPETSDLALGPDAPDTDTDAPGTADAEPRVVGENGWRPEMRLFDWNASNASTAEGADGMTGRTAEFESDTGDANWPDETAERAVLDFAAVRDTDARNDTRDAPADDEAADARAAFTPLFSRRTTGPDAWNRSEAPTSDHTPGESPVDASSDTSDTAETLRALAATDAALAHDDAETETEDGTSPPAAALEADIVAADASAIPDPTEPDLTVPDPTEDHAPTASDPAVPLSPVSFASARDTRPDTVGTVDGAAPDAEPVAAFAREDSALPSREEPAGDATPTHPHSRLTVLVGAGAAAAGDAIPSDAEGPRSDPLRTAEAQTGEAQTGEARTSDSRPDDAPSDETDFLDEEALRRIIAEVVREELQGALGERITRNVRKLVRREIRLVLAADELG
jgi:hypothetical protein